MKKILSVVLTLLLTAPLGADVYVVGYSGSGGGGGAVTNAGTFATQVVEGGTTAQVTATGGGSLQVECTSGCGGSGGASTADGATHIAGTTQGTAAQGVFDDASSGTLAEDKVGTLRATANRAMHVHIRTAAGVANDPLTDTQLRATAVPISGTVTATGPLTDTQLRATAVPVSGPLTDTQLRATAVPISVATIPSHAVTNAGTFATQVDGAALTALQLIDNLPVAQASTTSGQSGALVQGAVTTANPTYTTGQTAPLSLATDGALRVTGGGGGTEYTEGATDATITGSAILWEDTSETLRAVSAAKPLPVTVALVTAVGQVDDAAFTVATSEVTPIGGCVTSDSADSGDAACIKITTDRKVVMVGGDAAGSPTAGQVLAVQGIASGTPVIVGDGSGAINTIVDSITAFPDNEPFNVAQINGVTPLMGNGASGTGAQRVTLANDSTGQVALAAGSALVGQVAPAATATTTNSALNCYITSAASTNSTNCKTTAGNIYGYDLVNTTSTLYYLRLYDATAAPTCSSATGFTRTIPIPHGTGTGGGVVADYAAGVGHTSGIGFCLTGGGSSTDNTNAATGVYVTIRYK